jgi:hypothetical protein
MCQKDMNHYSSRGITGKNKNKQKMNGVCWNIQCHNCEILYLKFPTVVPDMYV